jgi:hypothetical protein
MGDDRDANAAECNFGAGSSSARHPSFLHGGSDRFPVLSVSPAGRRVWDVSQWTMLTVCGCLTGPDHDMKFLNICGEAQALGG